MRCCARWSGAVRTHRHGREARRLRIQLGQRERVEEVQLAAGVADEHVLAGWRVRDRLRDHCNGVRCNEGCNGGGCNGTRWVATVRWSRTALKHRVLRTAARKPEHMARLRVSVGRFVCARVCVCAAPAAAAIAAAPDFVFVAAAAAVVAATAAVAVGVGFWAEFVQQSVRLGVQRRRCEWIAQCSAVRSRRKLENAQSVRVPLQTWQGRAQSRCRCGGDDSSPGADVARETNPQPRPRCSDKRGVSAAPGAMKQRWVGRGACV